MPERADPAQAAGRSGVTIPEKQVPGVYHRRIGDIVVTALSDGYVDASYTVMRIAPEDAEAILARHFRPSPPRIAVNAFAVHSGGQLALVETGSGSDRAAPHRSRKHAGARPGRYRLTQGSMAHAAFCLQFGSGGHTPRRTSF